MTHKEILEKAIQKAIDRGWHWPYAEEFLIDGSIEGEYPDLYYWNGWEYVDAEYVYAEQIIYKHDFAKALWGNEEAGTEDFYSPKHNELSGSYTPEMWEYQLREMVISPDPIHYLGEHI